MAFIEIWRESLKLFSKIWSRVREQILGVSLLLIQKTLARRLKSESKQLEIEEHHVSDSEYEDVVSITRRLRYLYKHIKNLEHRIHKLEHR